MKVRSLSQDLRVDDEILWLVTKNAGVFITETPYSKSGVNIDNSDQNNLDTVNWMHSNWLWYCTMKSQDLLGNYDEIMKFGGQKPKMMVSLSHTITINRFHTSNATE